MVQGATSFMSMNT